MRPICAAVRNGAVWNALLADRAKIPAAMEEVLRISPSVITWRRRVLKTVTLHGIELPAGSNVLLLLGAANRDADVFENGEAFDLDRPNARNHLSLGFGIHYCIGALLAKMQLQIVLEELLERYPHLQLVPDQTFDYPRNASFRGPRAVLVEGLRSPAPAFGART